MLYPGEKNNPIKVMIVDDSMIIRKIFKKIFSQDKALGDILECKAFSEAVEQTYSFSPDIVVLDVILPDVMNVADVLSCIRFRLDLPIVMLASQSEEGMEIAIQCLWLGAVDFIGKPKDREEMKKWEIMAPLILAQIKQAVVAVPTIKQESPLPSLSIIKSEPTTIKSEPTTIANQLIILGGCTGSYRILLKIMNLLRSLPGTAILLDLYIPEAFLDFFVTCMNRICFLPVFRARPEEALKSGSVYVASMMQSCHRVVKKGSEIFLKYTPNLNILEDVEFCQSFAKTIESASVLEENALVGIFPGIGPGISQAISSFQKNKGQIFFHEHCKNFLEPMPDAIGLVPFWSTEKIFEVIQEFIGRQAKFTSTHSSQEKKFDLSNQNQIIENLKKIPVLSCVESSKLLGMFPQFKFRQCQKGEVILKKGEVGKDFFILYEGEVEVVEWKGDKEAIIATLSKGECFGEMSLLSGEPVSATIRVKEPSIIVCIDSSTFHVLLQKSPMIAMKITKLLAQRLQTANQQITRRLASGISGELETMPFPELIQSISGMGASGILSITSEKQEGRVYFQNGMVVDAVIENESKTSNGTECFYQMVRWQRGSFLFEKKDLLDRPQTITGNPVALLLEGLRIADEETRIL